MELTSKIQDQDFCARVAADCTQLIDRQISNKGGLSGVALKTAYKLIKGVGADYIPGAIQRLVPSAFKALDPLWQEGVRAGDPVAHLSENSDRAADIILSTTDARAHKASGVVATSYNKLRKSIKGDVVDAVPGLAQIIDKHVS